MKVNSNTFSLDEKDHADITAAVKKIAEDNGIDNVKRASIDLSNEKGVIKFELAEEVDATEQTE